MKKIIVSVLFMTLVLPCTRVHALDIDNFKQPAVWIASGIATTIGVALTYLCATRNSEAAKLEKQIKLVEAETKRDELVYKRQVELLEQERKNLEAKKAYEEKEKKEMLKKLYFEAEKKHEILFAAIGSKGKVTKEDLDKALVAYRNYQFPHISFSREMHDIANNLMLGLQESGNEERIKFNELIKKARVALDANNNIYNKVMNEELKVEQQTIAQQKQWEQDIAIKQQELKAKQIETECFQKLSNQIGEQEERYRKAYNDIVYHAQDVCKKIESNANALYEASLLQHGMVLGTIQGAMSAHVQNIEALQKDIALLKKSHANSAEMVRNVSERLDKVSDRLVSTLRVVQEVKENMQRLNSHESKEILKKLEAMEIGLANMAADIADMKNGPQNYEPSAPPRDF